MYTNSAWLLSMLLMDTAGGKNTGRLNNRKDSTVPLSILETVTMTHNSSTSFMCGAAIIDTPMSFLLISVNVRMSAVHAVHCSTM